MLDVLISRDAMIEALAEAYGTHPQLWRRMDQADLERAYSYSLYRWSH